MKPIIGHLKFAHLVILHMCILTMNIVRNYVSNLSAKGITVEHASGGCLSSSRIFKPIGNAKQETASLCRVVVTDSELLFVSASDHFVDNS